MGSSKKHKDRERDKEHKRKRRHRSRSRSREKKSRRHGEERHSHRKREDERTQRADSPPSSRIQSTAHRVKVKEETDPVIDLIDEPIKPSSAGGDLSLSVADTNALRAKLGLKPLDTGDSVKKEPDALKKEDVHAPAANLASIKKAEELREKMRQIKEKRKINMKLGKVKTLGESDSDDDVSALSWVKKNRKLQKEREQAEKRAKILEEMDQEFGISDLVDAEFGEDKKKRYGSKDLKGLTVQHAHDSFQEGKTVILTLQDKGILDEDADKLVNYNILDDERAAKNVLNKKKKPEYNPYDDSTIDEYGMYTQAEVLNKYDDEIYGAKKESFELGGGGKYNAEHERRMKQMKAEVAQRGESLRLDAPQLATEFYTEEEMATFKKVKKKVRKIRKKKVVKADDLISLDVDATFSSDMGSRSRGQDWSQARKMPTDVPMSMIEKSEPIPGLDFVDERGVTDMDIDQEDPLEETEILGPEEDLSGVVVNDDAGVELELALSKARRLKHRGNEAAKAEQALAARGLAANEDSSDDEAPNRANIGSQKGMSIVLNSTSEFCRSLGEIPTYGQSGNREEDEDELMDFEKELVEERKKRLEEDQTAQGWQTVDIDTRPVDIRDEEHTGLEEEPVIDSGIGAALALAQKKGFLEKETAKKSGATVTGSQIASLESQNYSIEDKRYDDLDEKFRKRDRYMGGVTQDFKELDGYKPEIKINYVDERGRNLEPKEAFRQLSHRFHGKGSGKKKTEKRSKKVEEEQLMRTMSSSDTPLGTLCLLQQKQKAEKTAYIVLSGNKGITATNLSKPS